VQIGRAVILTGTHAGAETPWPSVRGAKHLVPVANKPILFHNLEALEGAGVRSAVIVAEPRLAGRLRDAVGDGTDWGMDIDFLHGRAREGLESALARASDVADGQPILVESADTLLSGGLSDHVRAFADDALDALSLRLAQPESLSAGYLLGRRAVSALASEHAPDPDDVLATLGRHGGHVRVEDVDGCRPCHGGQEALLEANRRMLSRVRARSWPHSLSDSRLQGAVEVHPTARVERSTVRGPAIIGAGACIVDAYVGPYTSIGDRARIEGVELEHSIVLEGAQLRFLGVRLESSVIGRHARIERRFELPSALRLTVGDGAEVALA
jgi:glucose-1-phosphate thymidylyltransferase